MEESGSYKAWFNTLILILFGLFLITGIIVFLGVLYSKDYAAITDREILSFVVISTSVVTGSFFITKIYVNSQISIKEKEMGKEFREYIKEISKTQQEGFDRQDARFDRQDGLIDKRFAEQDAKFTEQNSKLNHIETLIIEALGNKNK